MADEKHVQLLNEGVAGWDSWRDGETGLIPDLVEANFHNVEGLKHSKASTQEIGLAKASRTIF